MELAPAALKLAGHLSGGLRLKNQTCRKLRKCSNSNIKSLRDICQVSLRNLEFPLQPQEK